MSRRGLAGSEPVFLSTDGRKRGALSTTPCWRVMIARSAGASCRGLEAILRSLTETPLTASALWDYCCSLHYTTVTLGTPGIKFLVALDTGSDLFWVPCATEDDSPYASDFDFRVYDPHGSATSRIVTCDSDLCMRDDGCNDMSSPCPYHVSYISSDTSSSGILVEDVLQLKTVDKNPELIKAFVTFGCGQVQTGSFLDIAAPNGLLGLGLEKVAVPSILYRDGYIENSFSMCFGDDGTGRIFFGDKGSPDQEETPFHMNPFHPTYSVNVTQVRVGTSVVDSQFTALFDSGTSFTYLVEPTYTMVADSFHLHIQDHRRPPDPRIPFEYCYTMSPDMNTSLIPVMSLSMDGGGQMVVQDPIIVISTPLELIYCLAVVENQELNIIGQNFMTGYRIVFNREKLVLGWKKSNCYGDTGDSNDFEARSVNYAASAGGLNGTVESESAKTNRTSACASAFYRGKFDWYAFLLSVVLAIH
ncbi:aspartyl protease family protein 1 isoform X2 [Andrographis paniculata]|uniref:aspartyl protease family protein 1 isoform X2 n=1 Tax=Andrographis paniculata TaxID=175694 RepID=UPI0021E76C84|nr:aspartyl protease family protein 1 isoform X2 [Andrographis paniculata]